MKKFFFYLFLVIAVLSVIFISVLYTEGAFDSLEPANKSDMKPFEMKCESGKCDTGKCASK